MLDLLLDVDVCISFLSRVSGEVFGFPAFIVGFYVYFSSIYCWFYFVVYPSYVVLWDV